MKLSNAYLLGLFALTLTMTGCSGGEEEVETNDEAVCSYSYDAETTEFEWTAFKFADKSGAVPGTFSDITVESEMSEDSKEVIESISFKINTSSVETQNEDRNKKISEFFFGTINTETIEGNIKSLNDDGTAVVVVTMNGISFDVEGSYTMEDNTFSFETTIDVANWNALSGITELNKVCEDLHRKAPGEESKLWSEVTLKLKTTLGSDC